MCVKVLLVIRADSAALKIVLETPRAPAWAQPTARALRDENALFEAAFLAGAGLAALDAFLRMRPPWSGVWRRRLALAAAAQSLRLVGCRGVEASLRDAWALRRPGADPGPAGRVLGAWRALADPSDALREERIDAAAVAFGIPLGPEGRAIALAAQSLHEARTPALIAAAEIARLAAARRPDAELLALWLADAMLALRLNWPAAAPLLANQVLHPSLRSEDVGRRPRPGDADWTRACCLAYARAASAACELGAELSRRAERLYAAAPKLRAKAAQKIVAALLEDDVLSAGHRIEGISDRGLRRLFDRLTALGAVRELSGRETFRLYGL